MYCASNISCNDTILSVSLKIPLLTRRNSCICPPVPTNNPAWTQKVRTYVPASHWTQKIPNFRCGLYSINLLSYIVRIRNCRLTAEINGGRWNKAPRNVVSIVRYNNFESSRVLCNRNTPIYSFPALCCALTNRVARSKQTIKHPVTLGSNVPECPVRSTRNIRLIHETTS